MLVHLWSCLTSALRALPRQRPARARLSSRAGLGVLLGGFSSVGAQALGPVEEAPQAAPLTALAPGCPPSEFFERELQSRLRADLRAQTLARAFTVRVERASGSAGSYQGTLSSALPELEGLEQPVVGQQCESVLRALSLIAALSAERAASSAERPAGSAENEPGSSVSQGSQSEEGASFVITPAAVPPGADAAGRFQARPWRRVRLAVDAFAVAQTAVSSHTGVDLGAGLLLTWPEAPGVPTLRFGASLHGAEVARVTDSTGQAQLQRVTAHGQGCVGAIVARGDLVVQPCAHLDVGAIQALGSGLARGWERNAVWLGSGAGLRGTWLPMPALQLGVDAGLEALLIRPYFYFRPSLVAFEVAPLGARVGAGLSVFF